MKKNKVFKTLEEQIELFQNRGLIVNDKDKALEILFRENYFFLNGYRHLLVKKGSDNTYVNGSTFEELYGIFVFDRKIRNIMFKNLLIVENNIKSIISYQLSKKYGYKEKDYLNPNNFRTDSFRLSQVNDIINKMKRQIRVNSKQHKATKHYLTNYGYIPLWVSVKVLSFGIISELFSILKIEDQLAICDYYKIDPLDMEIYLSILSNYRNLCAHEDILYDHRTQRSIPDNHIHDYLNIEQDEYGYIYGKNDLYAVIIIMKQMLNELEFRDFINEISYEIDRLDGKIESVGLNAILNQIGFPNNWRDILNID